jgi:hypothetical protein
VALLMTALVSSEMTIFKHSGDKYYTLRSLPQFLISVILACPVTSATRPHSGGLAEESLRRESFFAYRRIPDRRE